MKQLGLKHYMLDRATSSSLWVCQCGWEKCPATHIFGPAIRDHYLIHYIVSGKGTFSTDKGDYKLSKGQGFLISPNETTTYSPDKEDPWEYYWVGFKGIDAKHLLELCSLNITNPVFECEETNEISKLFAQMFKAYTESRSREYSMLGNLYLILAYLMSHVAPKSFTSSNIKQYLNSAIEYINNNYSYDINVTKIAMHVGIDRTYLYRIFKEGLNLSPERYLLKLRMTKAANLLKTTDLSVLQIALSTGYKETSHFSSAFKKFFSLTPSKYRQ